MRLFFSFLILIFIYSCGKKVNVKEDSLTLSEEHLQKKPLFSRWRSVVRGNDLNLTNGKFNSSINIPINISTGTTCDCFVFVSGNEASGTLRLSQCFNRAGHVEDYDCEKLNGHISYSKTGFNLRLTCFDTPLCGSYR